MSSLFDQLSSSGGRESTTRSTHSSSTYHGGSYRSTTGSGKDTWAWARKPAPKKQQQQRQQQGSNVIRMYQEPNTSRPYAYEPSKGDMTWRRPTKKEVLIDMMWKIAEAMIAAAGMAVAEFFIHRRFHPGAGVKW